MTDDEKLTKEKREAFIREAAHSGATGRKKVFKKLLITGGLALVFGIVAALSFFVTRKLLPANDSTTASESITIFSSDDPAASTAITQSVEDVTDADSSGIWAELSPSVHSEAEKVYENNTNKNAQYAAWQKAVALAESSLVSVTSQNDKTDLFGNVVSDAITRTGVIIGKTTSEFLILTYSDVTKGEGIFVTFFGTEQISASLKASDEIFGIAVIAVDIHSLSEANRKLEPIHFASVSAGKGAPVIAVGMPQGKTSSVLYGILSNVNSTISGTDAIVKLLQTDIASTEGTNGVLINTNGELLAWITDNYSNYSVAGNIAALSLNDMKASIESLSNAKSPSLLGIRGQVVTEILSDKYSLPVGIYVSSTVTGRAAEEAGIMAGDVIVGINENEVISFAELASVLNKHKSGDKVSVKLLRAYQGGYEEMIIEVTLQSR